MSQKDIGFSVIRVSKRAWLTECPSYSVFASELIFSSLILTLFLPELDENHRVFADCESQLQVLYPNFGHQPFLLLSPAVIEIQPQFQQLS